MPTSYPGAIDAFTNPSASSATTSPSHAGQHANANDAIEAIETKLGTGASTPVAGTVLKGTGTGASAWEAAGGSDLLAVKSYAPATDTTIGSTTSTSLVAVDTTNLRQSVTVPANGQLLITLEATSLNTAGPWHFGVIVAGVAFEKTQMDPANTLAAARKTLTVHLTGLPAGVANVDFAFAATTGTTTIYGGPTLGKAIMVIRSTPF